MEFNEKLQELRKKRGMTQEELADILHVSRTAVSKWESGRGYPNIESLKDISKFFSVSIDDLLSGEKLLSIAENENKTNIKRTYDLLYGIVDLLSFVLIILPIFPNTVDGFIYSVSLINYREISLLNIVIYWVVFVSLMTAGAVKLIFMQTEFSKGNKIITGISMIISFFGVIFLSLAREAYAVVLIFLLLLIKGAILINRAKIGK